MRDPKSTLPPSASVRPAPVRARVKKAPADLVDAAFAAGAALGALDAWVRAEPVFAGSGACAWGKKRNTHRSDLEMGLERDLGVEELRDRAVRFSL
jgi:hypothetical protein